MTKVSVVIPACDPSPFLARAIDSALGQTHRDLEVVVVADGSAKEAMAVASRHLAAANFKVVAPDRSGRANALDRGVRESTGAYVCFLDPDDTYLPEKVARQTALLDADLDLAFVVCDTSVVDPSGQPAIGLSTFAQAWCEAGGDLFASLIAGDSFPAGAVMIRRTVLDAVGSLSGELEESGDYEFWLRVSGAGYKAAFVPEGLVVTPRRPDGVGRDGRDRDARVAILCRMISLYPDRVAAGLEQAQVGLQDLHAANQWLRQRHEERSAPPPAAPEPDFRTEILNYALNSIIWKSKLEAGIELASLGHSQAAVKKMTEAIKAVQSCRIPNVILEALLEIPVHLGPLDPGRARYLLGMAVNLAEKGGRTRDRDQAMRLMADLSVQRPVDPAVRRDPSPTEPCAV